jgi:hypothetical protein
VLVAKDKKKNKGKKDSSVTGKAGKGLQAIAQNPLVADVVAAALVATAAAIRDNRKARQLAEQAGDELTALAKQGADKGNAMWQLALDIGRKAVDSLGGEPAPKSAKRPKPAKSAKPSRPSRPSKPSKPSKLSKARKPAKKPKRVSARAKAN